MSISLHLDTSKKYLLAHSGGIDSMALFHLLLQGAYQFAVVHCNFQLRGAESNLDEEFVRQVSHEHRIPFFTKRFDTISYAGDKGISIQEAARELRYAYFESLRAEHSFHYILTAHHKNDTIETALFHYFRGSGIKGLLGIPEKNGFVLRPLLHVYKDEIRAFVKQHCIAYREDSSNAKSDYTRNKIRLEVIPFLKQYFPEIENTLYENILRLQPVYEMYHTELKRLIHICSEWRKDNLYIFINKLKTIPNRQQILYEILKPFHFSYAQSQEVAKLCNSTSGAYVVSHSHRVIKYNAFLIVAPKSASDTCFTTIEEHENTALTPTHKIQLEVLDRSVVHITGEHNPIYLDKDNIEYPLIVRNWKQGDYMYPLGMTKKKKVARILIDCKIPLHEKEKVLVVESKKRIVCILNLKIDNRFKITEKTKQVLKITIE